MIRFLVLYPQPTDPVAFDRHYFETHLPLARKLPGLLSYTVSRTPARIRGTESFYLVAHLDWEDLDTLKENFASPLGQALAQDVDKLAEFCPGIQSMICELETV